VEPEPCSMDSKEGSGDTATAGRLWRNEARRSTLPLEILSVARKERTERKVRSRISRTPEGGGPKKGRGKKEKVGGK